MLEAADMTTRDEADRMLEQAMDWLIQLRDAPADPALRSRIDLWIAEEPGHARAWEQANNTWRLLGELQPSRPPERVRERSSALRRVFWAPLLPWPPAWFLRSRRRCFCAFRPTRSP